jgi:hypothetical protein
LVILEGCAAWNSLSLPVVAASGVSHLLDGVVEVAVVQGVGRVVDIASGLIGNCNVSLIGRSFLVDVGLSWDINVDVGFGHDLIVNVSEGRDRCIIDLLDRGSSCGKSRVVGSKELGLGGVDFGGVCQKLGGGGGQADNDGENNLEGKEKLFVKMIPLMNNPHLFPTVGAA